jgi:hypothetical protein
MPAETTVKKGNRYPALESTLSEGGAAINLEAPVNAVAVKLRIKKVGGTVEEKSAEFAEKKTGKVRYKWTKADTETTLPLNVEGEYQYEWVVEWAAGEVENFPSSGFKTLAVVATV